ncbi:hypothetical protein L1049_007529 [Liquidambar formosana]|uniref:Uncharacterized protein n=1 Tax=Liquidambar formosana TaxID=63359 RepID=A0AAP0X1J5_LIQFO
MISEITEDEDEDAPCIINKEAQKERIRQIIQYQKSLYLSSSSSSSYSSSAASCSSFSSSRKSSSLLELMKGGSTSLRRLFDMEHTSLATHFEEYSGSPIIKSIPLWGSDSDDGNCDPWASIKQIGPTNNPGSDGPSRFGSDSSFKGGESGFRNRKTRISNRKLTRKKAFRRLPGFGLWRCRGFRFRLRLRRLRIMICGRKF